MHTRTHILTGTYTHERTDYATHNLKRATNRDPRRRKTAARNGKHARKKMSSGLISRSPGWGRSFPHSEHRFPAPFSKEGCRKPVLGVWVIPCRGAEDRTGAETNSGKSGTRNLEAESIRSRAESTGGCVEDSQRDKTEQCP